MEWIFRQSTGRVRFGRCQHGSGFPPLPGLFFLDQLRLRTTRRRRSGRRPFNRHSSFSLSLSLSLLKNYSLSILGGLPNFWLDERLLSSSFGRRCWQSLLHFPTHYNLMAPFSGVFEKRPSASEERPSKPEVDLRLGLFLTTWLFIWHK